MTMTAEQKREERKKRVIRRVNRFFGGRNIQTGMAADVLAIHMGKTPNGYAKYAVARQPLLHRRNYAAAGHSNLQFFNEGEANGVTNLPRPGQLDNNHVFVATSIGVQITQGITRDGGTQKTALPTAANAAEIEDALALGRLIFTVDNERVIDAFDLRHFPAGAGVNAALAMDGNGSAASGVVVNNGTPGAQARYDFGPRPLLIAGGTPIKASIEWPAPVSLAGGGVLDLALEGFWYRS